MSTPGTHYRNAVRGGSMPGSGGQCVMLSSIGQDASYFDEKIEPPVRGVCLQFSSNSLTVLIDDSYNAGLQMNEPLQYEFRSGGQNCLYDDGDGNMLRLTSTMGGTTTVQFNFYDDSSWYDLGTISSSQRLPVSCSNLI